MAGDDSRTHYRFRRARPLPRCRGLSGARRLTAPSNTWLIPGLSPDRDRMTTDGLDYVNETLAAAVGDVPAGPLGPVLSTR